MDNNETNDWLSFCLGGTIVVINWFANIFTLKILVNTDELISKIITAVIVGFIGGAMGMLGKMFVTWVKKTRLAFPSKTKKP